MAFRWTSWFADKSRQRVATHLIFGMLGAGKTTLIRHLLGQRPPLEAWAVIVNENGEASLEPDKTSATGDPGVSIHPVGGGCVCCDARLQMQMVLRELVLERSPQRLLIEPTGAGHSLGVLRSLLESEVAERLDLRATLCVVDPRHLQDKRFTESSEFQQQAQLADILLANKIDLASKDELHAFGRWAATLAPGEARVLRVQHGRVELHAVDRRADLTRLSLGRQQPREEPSPNRGAGHGARDVPAPSKPLRSQTRDGGCSWLFSKADVFSKSKIIGVVMDLAGHTPAFAGIRAALRTDAGPTVLTWQRGTLRLASAGELPESRFELLEGARAQRDWDAIEHKLLGALLTHEDAGE
ncbi:MAG: GTP-binding protein [Proteobacteria bacterium]|nr:GTP-binding protein [Pseudomonadota bacterium]